MATVREILAPRWRHFAERIERRSGMNGSLRALSTSVGMRMRASQGALEERAQ
jgi:hypothetical protein